MTTNLERYGSRDRVDHMRQDCQAFAAKIRMARAVLGWSQSELAFRIGLTQRAVHKLEQGTTEPRRATVRALEEVWHNERLAFTDLIDGGFQVSVPAASLDRPVTAQSRRHRAARLHLGVTTMARQ